MNALTEALRFSWPNPPDAPGLPQPAMSKPVGCDILGLNNKRAPGTLIRFDPGQGSIEVQLLQTRRSVTLRFDQFRMLLLTEPQPLPQDLSHGAGLPYDVEWSDGSVDSGQTLGEHVTAFGTFLFLPAKGQAAVLRTFLPRQSFVRLDLHAPRAAAQPGGTPVADDDADDAAAATQREMTELMAVEVTTPEQLLRQLALQTRMPIVRIGEALTSLGFITEEQLRQGLEAQQLDRNVQLGETLVQMALITREQLQMALARKMGYPLVDLHAFPAAAEALRKISHETARRLQVMPLMLHDGRLIVALDDPANRHSVLDEVEFIGQTKVSAVLGVARDLDSVLHQAYERIGAADPSLASATSLDMIEFDAAGTSELLQTLEKEGSPSAEHDAPIEQSDNSLVRMINQMILEAHRGNVSDIHIESYPGREKIRIRFRKDGRLSTYLELPPNYRSALIARIKIMCDLDISEKRKPQDGKINFSKFMPQHRIELRVATIPTNNGLEDVVMRILASARPIALDKLGLSERNLAQFTAAIERPYGMVLCVGPTGSGKTTTLHSALMHINTPERKIWTAEDPIEITQIGLRQVQVNPRIDWTFAKALRAFVRADPDVIMVGEIRDEETAKTAIEASLTGHLVLSTLHTNSAPETVTRLLDMGMDPFNFADSLLAVLAQRLVRRLCPQCKVAHPATQEQLDKLMADYMQALPGLDSPEERDVVIGKWLANHGQDGQLLTYSPVGCKHCDDTGFKGRVGLHELMVISRGLRRMIQTGARAEELQAAALAEGMRTLRQDGIDKILSGHTTLDEVRATSNA
ncbi:MAG: ATPase, T2SS/T4P/T4SS family [Burkholderiaceae bacterium]